MAYPEVLDQIQEEILEDMVNRFGVANVLESLGAIAWTMAEHPATPDDEGEKWRQVSQQLNNLADDEDILDVSEVA